MPDNFKYDAFISYSSEDANWALALCNELEERNRHIFVDRKRITAGDRWEEALLDALKDSRHLIVLWSRNAKESNWVFRECGHFDALVHSRQTTLAEVVPIKRKMVFVSLDERPSAYASGQLINDLAESGVYDKGIDELKQVNSDLWRSVVDKIDVGIHLKGSVTSITLAVLAMRSADLRELNPIPPAGRELNELLRELHIPNGEALASHYGVERMRWRPFGSERNIREIADELMDELNRRMAQANRIERFEWDVAGDEFWSRDLTQASVEIDRVVTGPSVVILDPISLYDALVRDRLGRVERCLESDQSALVVLSPFPLQHAAEELRSVIGSLATTIYNRLYDPIAWRSRVEAHCSVSVEDDRELRRLFHNVVYSTLAGKSEVAGEAYRRVGI